MMNSGCYRWLPDTNQAFHQTLEMRFQLGVTSGRHVDWLRIAAHRNRHSLGVERILRDQLVGFLVRLRHRDRRRVLVRRRYLVIVVLVGHARRA